MTDMPVEKNAFSIIGSFALIPALILFAVWHFSIAPQFNRPDGYDTYEAAHARWLNWWANYGDVYRRRLVEETLSGKRDIDSINDPALREATRSLLVLPHDPQLDWQTESRIIVDHARHTCSEPLRPYLKFDENSYVYDFLQPFVFLNAPDGPDRLAELRQGLFFEHPGISVKEIPANILMDGLTRPSAYERPHRSAWLYLIGWLVYSGIYFGSFLWIHQFYTPDKAPLENPFTHGVRPQHVYDGLLWFAAAPAFLTYTALSSDLDNLPWRRPKPVQLSEEAKLDEAIAFATQMSTQAQDASVREQCSKLLTRLEQAKVRLKLDPVRYRLSAMEDMARLSESLEELDREIPTQPTQGTTVS